MPLEGGSRSLRLRSARIEPGIRKTFINHYGNLNMVPCSGGRKNAVWCWKDQTYKHVINEILPGQQQDYQRDGIAGKNRLSAKPTDARLRNISIPISDIIAQHNAKGFHKGVITADSSYNFNCTNTAFTANVQAYETSSRLQPFHQHVTPGPIPVKFSRHVPILLLYLPCFAQQPQLRSIFLDSFP